MELTGRCCTLRLSSLCYLSSVTTAVAMQQLPLSSSLCFSITVWVSIMLYKIFWGKMKKCLLISKRAPISDIESNQISYWADSGVTCKSTDKSTTAELPKSLPWQQRCQVTNAAFLELYRTFRSFS